MLSSDVKTLIQQLVNKIAAKPPQSENNSRDTQDSNSSPEPVLANLSTVDLKKAYLSACCEHIPYYGSVVDYVNVNVIRYEKN